MSHHHVSGSISEKQSKVTTPRVTSSKVPTESFFKQSILLNKLLYAHETPVSASATTPASGKRSTASSESDSDLGEEFTHHNSVERLLLHAKLCFDENFLKIMPPSLSELTFTVIALKVSYLLCACWFIL